MKKMRNSNWTWFALLALFVSLAGWSLSSPPGSSPDDDFHLASIWCGQGERPGICEVTQKAQTYLVPSTIQRSNCFAYAPNASADCQNNLVADPASPLMETTRGNFAGLYPPLFYSTMSVFVGNDVNTSVLLMRFFNSLLFTATIGGLLTLIAPKRRIALVWSFALTMVPLGFFIVASTNPSSWAITGVGGFWLALLTFAESSGKRRLWSAVASVALATMAAGSRGDAAVYIAISCAVVCVLVWPKKITRPFVVLASFAGVIALVCMVAFLQTGQVSVVTEGLTGPGGASQTNPLVLTIMNALQLPVLWAGSFGSWGLGWLDTTLPAAVWLPGLGAFTSVLFIAFGNAPRRHKAMAASVGVALTVIPLYVLARSNAVVGTEVQPRYILPLITLLAGICLLSVSQKPVFLGRSQTLLVVISLVVANALALHVNINRYIRGQDSHDPNLNNNDEWWWSIAPTPMVVWIVSTLAFCIAAGIAAHLLRFQHSEETNKVQGRLARQTK